MRDGVGVCVCGGAGRLRMLMHAVHSCSQSDAHRTLWTGSTPTAPYTTIALMTVTEYRYEQSFPLCLCYRCPLIRWLDAVSGIKQKHKLEMPRCEETSVIGTIPDMDGFQIVRTNRFKGGRLALKAQLTLQASVSFTFYFLPIFFLYIKK